jgi:hypothetical protein
MWRSGRGVAADDVGPVSYQAFDELMCGRQAVESLHAMDAYHLAYAPGPGARLLVERELAEACDAVEGPQTCFGARAQAKEIQQMLFARRAIDVEWLAR